jgi:AspT/YidE/YbjL antiporter-like protein
MFDWIDYLAQGAVAKAVLALSLVIAVGLALGSPGVRGVRLGTAGVLFAGLFLGQAGLHIDISILEFARDFGLILFVYTVGLQVGPSFFSSLKRQGLELNILGASIVLLGGIIVIAYRFLFHFSLPAVIGLFSGSTTNTPSLAAGQAALLTVKGVPVGSSDLLGMAYAIAYPFGVVGIIISMLLFRKTFSASSGLEQNAAGDSNGDTSTTEFLDIEVRNPNLDGVPIRDLPFVTDSDIVFSRLCRNGKVVVPEVGSVIRVGDSVRVVGARAKLAEFETIIGAKSAISLADMPAPVRLGLAGGPLIVALCLSRVGRVGPLIWYMTPGANLVIREIGIALFLACVGLKAGGHFLEVLFSSNGLAWLLGGACLTLVPLLAVGFVARKFLRIDFPTLCGVLAGSMTDPPALAFATSFTESDRPLTAYAAVYPLVMIMRVFLVQILILTLPL